MFVCVAQIQLYSCTSIILVLIVAQVYQTILTIYEYDSEYTFPTRNEVLICHQKTTEEQVKSLHLVIFTYQHI